MSIQNSYKVINASDANNEQEFVEAIKNPTNLDDAQNQFITSSTFFLNQMIQINDNVSSKTFLFHETKIILKMKIIKEH